MKTINKFFIIVFIILGLAALSDTDWQLPAEPKMEICQ